MFKVRQISTVKISQTVTDGTHITTANTYEVANGLLAGIFT